MQAPETPKQTPPVSAWKVVLITMGVILGFFIIIGGFGWFSDSNNAPNQTNNAPNQTNCLSSAYADYIKIWNSKADKDGNVAYKDGWLTLQTNYYDAEINCYRQYPTSDSDGRISDVEAKRNQDTTEYDNWVNSLTRGGVDCTSIQSGTFTNTHCN
jgi:hypothetical protein